MLTYRVKLVSPCVVIMILTLAACAQPVPIPGVGDPQTPTIAAVEPGGPANALENTEWTLISYGPPGAETPVIESSGPSLQFEAENRAGGYAGCNTYGGSYRVDGDSLSFSDIFRTLMACQDQAIMQQEDRYLEALQTTGEFDIDGDRLTIVYGDGQGVLNFVRPTAVAAIPTPTQAEAGLTPTPSGRSPAPAESVEATPTGAAAEPYPYLDDRSAPSGLVHSYFNAINRKEYARAYSYWRDPAGALGPFDQFQAGYEDTVAVDLTLGQVGGDAGAGQLYYSVPVILKAHTTDGITQTFAGCYILHLANPAAQAEPPFRPLAIRSAEIEQVSNDAGSLDLLNRTCTP